MWLIRRDIVPQSHCVRHLVLGLFVGYFSATVRHDGVPHLTLGAAPPLTYGIKAWIPKSSRVTVHLAGVAADSVRSEAIYQSQAGQDAFLEAHFFPGLRNGTFLELGGADGWTDSNTVHFEMNMGWTGVLIEPSPDSFAELVQNRPNAYAFNAAICREQGHLHFVSEGSPLARTIWEYASPDLRRQFYPNVKSSWDVERITVAHVTCIPLRELLATANIRHLDLWTLDVEGAEYEVLQTFDFDRVTVDVLMIETKHADPDVYERSRDLLRSRGFVEYTGAPSVALMAAHPKSMDFHALDAYWIRNDFAAIAERRRAAAGT